MESKLHENLYFAGEIVNIDASPEVLISRMLGQVGLLWQVRLVKKLINKNLRLF